MPSSTETRVLLYSDQVFLADGLAAALSSSGEFRLVGACAALADVARLLESQNADIVLLDVTDEITLSLLDGIRRAEPRAKLALWASGIPKELAFQAMQLGVRGILRRTSSAAAFLAALRAIRDGELWFEKELLEDFIYGARTVLTRREGQLVALISQGLKNKEIAGALHVTEGTVKVYLSHLYKKLGVNDRLELALFGLKNMQSGYQLRPPPVDSPGAEAGGRTPGLRVLLRGNAPQPPAGRQGPTLPPTARPRQAGDPAPLAPLRPHPARFH